MKTQFYFPAPVEVVKVTNENLAEVAEWCGGRVAATESRRVAGRMDSYVWVPTPKGNSISWAFPGMYITKRMVVTVKDEMKTTFQVFRRDYFSRNYFDTPTDAVDKTWEKDSKKKQHPKPKNIFAGKKIHKTKAEVDAICDAAGLDHNKEDDMKNKHGVPINETTPDKEMDQAVQNLTEGIPGVEEVTDGGFATALTDTQEEYREAFDAMAGGQVLEGGEIEQVADDAASAG